MFPRDEKSAAINSTLPPVTAQFANVKYMVAKRFFYREDIHPGCGFDELLTAACYIQYTIFLRSETHIINNLGEKIQAYKNRWDKYICLKAIRSNEGYKFILNPDHPDVKRHSAIIDKYINMEYLAHYLSPAALVKQSDPKTYINILFDEAESFIKELLEKEATPPIEMLTPLYSTDFSYRFLRHSVLEEKAAQCAGNRELQERFYEDFCDSAIALMEFANSLSDNILPNLAGISLPTTYNSNENSIEGFYLRINKYFDFDQIDMIISCKINKTIRNLLFLTSMYSSAHMIKANIKSWPERTLDVTNYKLLRKVCRDLELVIVNPMLNVSGPRLPSVITVTPELIVHEFKDLETLYKTSFAKIYLNHEKIYAAAKQINKPSKLILYINTIKISKYILQYCNDRSQGWMPNITLIDKSYFSEKKEFFEMLEVSILHYLNLKKLNEKYMSCHSYEAELLFLSSICVSAYQFYIYINNFLVTNENKYRHPFIPEFKLDSNNMAKVIEALDKEYREKGELSKYPQYIPLLINPTTPPSSIKKARPVFEKYFNMQSLQINREISKVDKFIDEIAICVCFLQYLIDTITDSYFTTTNKNGEEIKARWKRFIDIKPCLTNPQQGIIYFISFDKKDPKQVQQANILKKHLDFDKVMDLILNHKKIVIKNLYFQALFDELENYMVRAAAPQSQVPTFTYPIKTDLILQMQQDETRTHQVRASAILACLQLMRLCNNASGNLVSKILKISLPVPHSNACIGENEFIDCEIISSALRPIENDFRKKLEYLTAICYFTFKHYQEYGVEKNDLPSNKTISEDDVKEAFAKIAAYDNFYQFTGVQPIYNEYLASVIFAEQEEKQVPKNTTKPKNEKQKKKPSQQSHTRYSKTFSSDSKPSNPEFNKFGSDYLQTKQIIDSLDSNQRSLRDPYNSLTRQLKQCESQDKDSHYIKEEVKEKIKSFDTKISSLIDSTIQIKTSIASIKYNNEDELDENKKQLEAIRASLRKIQLSQEKLAQAMQAEFPILDHIIPKQKQTKAEIAFGLAQQKKEQQAREKEEKLKKELEKPKAPKPPTKPVPTLALAKATAPAKKPEQKTPSSKPGDEIKPSLREERIKHLNEAFKNLIWIQNILACGDAALVTHYALLYNIFRCFQSLKMYQASGGQKRTINPDEVVNLRNMIIHHGAGGAQPHAVKEFAQKLRGNLPKAILSLNHPSVARYDLSDDEREVLMKEFNLIGKNTYFSSAYALPMDSTELYIQLVRFHEMKTDNDDCKNVCETVLARYIPLIRDIIAPLKKANSHDCHMSPERFIDHFFFQLQALRMLTAICGEYEPHFRYLHKEQHLQAFLLFCRQSVKNPMGHADMDYVDEVFFRVLNDKLSKINEKNILDYIKSKKNSPAGLFHPNTLSAMDARFDKPASTPGSSYPTNSISSK